VNWLSEGKTDMNTERINRLYSLMKKSKIEVLALNPGTTLTYLTGLSFHLMERPTVLLLAPPASPAIVLPELERGKLRHSLIPLQPYTYSDNPATWENAFKQACQFLDLSGQSIGVEPNRMRFLELRFLESAAPGTRFVSAENVLNNLRILKDGQEIQNMRKAVEIAETALEATLPMIKIGTTEQEIASELTIQLLRAGSVSEFPFSPIVCSGPNSADSHAAVSDRKLIRGDLLVIDWGAKWNGYCSDLTRTFAINEIDPELAIIYQLVLNANTAGRATGKPGIAAGKIDQAARFEIEAGGYGKYFTHRVGHGIGLDDHEHPYMFGENEQLLIPGMSYTVEPGIYLPGRGGVRIEDDIVVTDSGSESLSHYPRELCILQ
jgi:Xaa-Pro dipeptidase